MSIKQIVETITIHRTLRDKVNDAYDQAGTVNSRIRYQPEIEELGALAFAQPGMTVGNLTDNIDMFSSAFLTFIQEQGTVRVMAKREWLTESATLDRSDPFVKQYVRESNSHKSSEKMDLAKYLRRVNMEPKTPTFEDVLRTLCLPSGNDQTPFSGYAIKPNEVLINKGISAGARATLSIDAPIRSEFTYVGGDSIYLIFKPVTANDLQYIMTPDLSSKAEVYATDVTLDFVNTVDGVFAPTALIHQSGVLSINHVQYPLGRGGNHTFQIGTGTYSLTLPPGSETPVGACLIVRMRGKFATNQCGLLSVFDHNVYSNTTDRAAWSGCLFDRVLKRTNGGCRNQNMSTIHRFLERAFTATFDEYVADATPAIRGRYSVADYINQFGTMMEKLFSVAEEPDVSFEAKAAFASHFYRTVLIIYGLSIYSL